MTLPRSIGRPPDARMSTRVPGFLAGISSRMR